MKTHMIWSRYGLVRFDGESKTFTQDEVNQILAKERGETEKKFKGLSDEIDLLKSKTTMTAKEKAELEQRLEATRTAGLSDLEKARHDLETYRKESEKSLSETKKVAEDYRTRYETSTIVRAISDAASEHGAYAPEQLVALLQQNTRLVEVLGEDQKPTGELNPVSKLEDVDAKGKRIILELSPKDIVKRMKEIPRYQNLFKGTGKGGLGDGKDSTRGGGATDMATLAKDPEAYRKARKEGRI